MFDFRRCLSLCTISALLSSFASAAQQPSPATGFASPARPLWPPPQLPEIFHCALPINSPNLLASNQS